MANAAFIAGCEVDSTIKSIINNNVIRLANTPIRLNSKQSMTVKNIKNIYL